MEKADGIISAGSLNLIGEAIKKVAGGERFVDVSNKALDKSCIYKQRKEGAIAIVPISEGCLGRCSYCATKLARGRLRSFSILSIVKEVEDA